MAEDGKSSDVIMPAEKQKASVNLRKKSFLSLGDVCS